MRPQILTAMVQLARSMAEIDDTSGAQDCLDSAQRYPLDDVQRRQLLVAIVDVQAKIDYFKAAKLATSKVATSIQTQRSGISALLALAKAPWTL